MDVVASEGKVTVYTKDNVIVNCQGKGTLTIGKNIKEISLAKYIKSGKASVTEFKVASGNKYFTVIDGVLFSKDKSQLVSYPDAKEVTSYTVKADVQSISEDAVAYNKYLKSVTIPKSVNTIGNYAFQNCAKLESVICKADISSIYGTFYNCKLLKSFHIPETVTEIMDNAFYNTAVSFEVDKYNTNYT